MQGLNCQRRPVHLSQAAQSAGQGRHGDEAQAAQGREHPGHVVQDQELPPSAQRENPRQDGLRLDEAPCPSCMTFPCACRSGRAGEQARPGRDIPDVPPQNAKAGPRPDVGAGAGDAATGSAQQLSEEEQRVLRELKQRDREVRAHEQAHVAAGGGHVQGGISYQYQTGPDGRLYAVGGSVNIDTSPVPGNPEATEEKARAVRRAALAPAQPSGQDRQVAARAGQMEAEARVEQRTEEAQKDNPLAPEANTPEAQAEKQDKAAAPGEEQPADTFPADEITAQDRRTARAVAAYGAQGRVIAQAEPAVSQAA
jgi:hypothetical protein